MAFCSEESRWEFGNSWSLETSGRAGRVHMLWRNKHGQCTFCKECLLPHREGSFKYYSHFTPKLRVPDRLSKEGRDAVDKSAQSQVLSSGAATPLFDKETYQRRRSLH